jgi:hypothetical protein
MTPPVQCSSRNSIAEGGGPERNGSRRVRVGLIPADSLELYAECRQKEKTPSSSPAFHDGEHSDSTRPRSDSFKSTRHGKTLPSNLMGIPVVDLCKFFMC